MARFSKNTTLVEQLAKESKEFLAFVDSDKKIRRLVNLPAIQPLLQSISQSTTKHDLIDSFIKYHTQIFKLATSSDPRDSTLAFELISKWDTNTQIQQKASYFSAVTRANMLTTTDEDLLEVSSFNSIANNLIPQEFTWDYWVTINQWFDYWVNQFEITCEDEYLYDLKTFLRVLIASGSVCMWMEENEFKFGYFVAIKDTKKIRIFSGSGLLGMDFYTNLWTTYQNKNSLNSSTWTIEKNLDDVVLVNWRSSGIGDYVWCLKPILFDILNLRVINANTFRCDNKRDIRAPNLEAAKRFSKLNSVASRIYTYFTSDSTQDNTETPVRPMLETNKQTADNIIAASIQGAKFHQEQYYTLMGRQITSSKSQSLSSDASLSVGSTEAIRNEHIWRVEHAFKVFNKKFGTNIIVESIEQPELDVQNQNADKGGMGEEKTEGNTSKKKSEATQ